MKDPLQVCITGPDGSGKSTACARVRELLDTRLGQGASAEVSVWDCLGQKDCNGAPIVAAFGQKDEAGRYLEDLDGRSRTLFIFHAMSRALELASRKAERKVLLLNGYWYKYGASEMGYGVEPETVLGAARGFPRPAATFFLEIDPLAAWARKRSATAYERGGAMDEGERGERFVAFQRRVQPHWERIEREQGGERGWQRLDALREPAELATHICEGVLGLLAEAGKEGRR